MRNYELTSAYSNSANVEDLDISDEINGFVHQLANSENDWSIITLSGGESPVTRFGPDGNYGLYNDPVLKVRKLTRSGGVLHTELEEYSTNTNAHADYKAKQANVEFLHKTIRHSLDEVTDFDEGEKQKPKQPDEDNEGYIIPKPELYHTSENNLTPEDGDNYNEFFDTVTGIINTLAPQNYPQISAQITYVDPVDNHVVNRNLTLCDNHLYDVLRIYNVPNPTIRKWGDQFATAIGNIILTEEE